MGQVIPLKNVYCDLKRMQELQAIGLLLFKSGELFASLRPSMSYDYRDQIVTQANQLLDEAHERRVYYFLSVGLPSPEKRMTDKDFKERTHD